MTQDEVFLADILAHPNDPSVRLIYADWLEEQGDPRAEYLRLLAEALRPELPDELREQIRLAIARLRPSFPREWVRALDLAAVENCDAFFRFECPSRWELLVLTEEPHARYCGDCRRYVYYCETTDEATAHGQAGHCIAVNSSLARKPRIEEDEDVIAGDFMMGEGDVLGEAGVAPDPQVTFPPGTLVRVRAGRYTGRNGVVVKHGWWGRVVVALSGEPKETVRVPLANLAERDPL